MSICNTNDQLLEIMLTMDVALFTKTVEGVYSYINAAGARMVERTVDDIVGHTDDEIFSPGTSSVIRVRDQYIRGVREPFAYDCKSLLIGEKTPIPFHSIKCSIRDAAGRTTGLLALSLVNRAPLGVHERVRGLVKDLAHRHAQDLVSICRRGSFPFAIRT